MNLKGKIAIVTGASRGVGAALALGLSEAGATIVVAARTRAETNGLRGTVDKTVERIKEKGGKAVGVAGSVTSREVAQKMVDTAVKEFGTLDILVNNAGITRDAMLHKMTDEQWDQVIDVNLKGVFFCTQCAIRVMREKEYGKIINISSTSAWGNPGQFNYAATKAGIIGMTKTAAKELGPKKINVNGIAPGMIWTDMLKAIPAALLDRMEKSLPLIMPLGRKGAPLDVANVALFLASDESSFVTGQVIHCDGGMIMS